MAVLWHVTMSLDGFVAGPEHGMEWAFESDGPSRLADEVMATTGAILGGRRWYDVATARYRGVDGIYGGNWSGPVFVLTHDPPPGQHHPAVTFLSGGVEHAVVTAQQAAGDGNVEIFGANLASQVLHAGLLDEIVVHLAPVLLGDGVRMYEVAGRSPVRLERTTVEPAGQLTDLRFRVPKGDR